MKKFLLFPSRFRQIGLALSPVFLALGIACLHFDFDIDFLSFQVGNEGLDKGENFTDEIAGAGLAICLFLAGFSRLKSEDEYTLSLRLSSLVQSAYVQIILLLIAFIFFYGLNFFMALTYVVFIPMMAYVFLFHLKLIRDEK